MPNFSILLPPSDAQVTGGNPLAPDMFDYRTSNTFNYFHDLNPERRKLIDQLHKVLANDKTDFAELFGESDEAALAEVLKTDSGIYNAPLMSALERYSPGVLYQAMDFSGLPTGAQRRLLEEGIIFSGIFGLLRPDDLIPEYRLPMDTDLPGIGLISDYWNEILSSNLNRALEDQFVWNMLPETQEAAWTNTYSYKAMVRLVFARKKGDEIIPVTKDVLPLYGKVVSLIVQETLEDLEFFLEWRHPAGYKPDLSLSTFDEETKTHTIMMVRRR